MGQALQNKINIWKKLLLDMGKRNRLINFIEGKRNNVKITKPLYSKLFDQIVTEERTLMFPSAKKVRIDDDGTEVYDVIINGDIETTKPLEDLSKTLKNLRFRAKTSIEEQGINTLYLTFGMLKWKEQDNTMQILSSPVVLVPVKLSLESLTSPYKLSLHEDEVVVNPILLHKLDNDFGIVLPEFDVTNDSLKEYLDSIGKMVSNKGWLMEYSVHLTNLSFLKINMYKDLERNIERLESNAVISALAGESDSLTVPESFNNFDHDGGTRPVDTFQVVDADSSQQDAILLSKENVSFVLQGPPGTGKSQTITNIISEALADGKKVLFVSEKMAALQVVYNRLSKVGLGDFCLTLHNPKTSKKEILRDLSNSVSINRTRVREEAVAQLNQLERNRQVLNRYHIELHTPASALHLSIFDVNGILAKLDNAPDIIFSVPNISEITQLQLGERVDMLKELSYVVGKRNGRYGDNVWCNSTVKYVSNQLRHDIDYNISQALPKLKVLENLYNAISSRLNLCMGRSLSDIDAVINIVLLVAKSHPIPSEWILDNDINMLMDSALEYKKKTQSLAGMKKALSDKYDDGIFTIDSTAIYDALQDSLRFLTNHVTCDDKNQLISNIDAIHAKLTSLIELLINAFMEAGSLSTKLGLLTPDSIDKVIAFTHLMEVLYEIKSLHPTRKWFDGNSLNLIIEDIDKHMTLHDAVISAKAEVLSRCDKEILDYDFYSMLQRFRSEYNSIFRIFSGKYRKDKKSLSSYLKSGSKLSYCDALEILNTLKLISDAQEKINAYKQYYEDCYGIYYAGIDTKWSLIKDAISVFEHNICSVMDMMTPDLIKDIEGGEIPVVEIEKFLSKYKSLPDVGGMYDNILSLLKLQKFDKDSLFSDVIDEVGKICSEAGHLISVKQEIDNLRKEPGNISELLDDMHMLTIYRRDSNELSLQRDALYNLFRGFYSGVDTDWDSLLSALGYAAEVKQLSREYDLPVNCIRSICENIAVIDFCCQISEEISTTRKTLAPLIQWYASLFKNGEEFYHYDLSLLYDRMERCMSNKYMLDEWVDYCSCKEKCNTLDLKEYISNIETIDIDAQNIERAYLKRFYRLWLDAILPDFPSVQNFRGRIHDQMISDFCDLDTSQFKIAQARVRERVTGRIPDFDSIHGAQDEIAILKRELNKQRRLMPLRKLFVAIPNLVTSLRPCFMMSPLSVSVFLEAKSYCFDMVIFDEASQVHTEDAIGAIMRGKQVIIVGDTQQLPPTNFFSASYNDEDFDEESDDDTAKDVGAYESILDESMTVLPERSLRWHYRSRHEHLIAFSNIKIYNNRLITFPSSSDSVPDEGVEYVYLPDGTYDRGGKKSNVTEAQKVADLVFEHIKKYPQRSLGVVTFSEAQQNAVDAAIRQKRLHNVEYESYFNEDRNDAFFVKNLENVQGDERDTVIFSIGYAKDKRGIMSMNFGPLSREGGYRRLNVAITRAKHNIKLVGSILPTDIDVEKVTSKGVKMLRSYIEFAQNGFDALERELTYDSSNINVESPFEESVYDFLKSKGYDVITQVGCSGFRIDMAIRHPRMKGQFAIGIECDGAMYHSSRTARERDRLRQSILEDMGWRIYRIWSTDWIKDQRSAEDRLVNAIEDSFIHAPLTDRIMNESIRYEKETSVDLEENVDYSVDESNEYGFDSYQCASIYDIIDSDAFQDNSEIIYKVISIEQPIHFEELCRRVSSLYGRQKVTSFVREQVQDILLDSLHNRVCIDEDEFIKTEGYILANGRIPVSKDTYVRSINCISDEELSLIMKTIAQKSYGIMPIALLNAMSRVLGYKRNGGNIMNTLHRIYDGLIDKRVFSEIDGKVHVE